MWATKCGPHVETKIPRTFRILSILVLKATFKSNQNTFVTFTFYISRLIWPHANRQTQVGLFLIEISFYIFLIVIFTWFQITSKYLIILMFQLTEMIDHGSSVYMDWSLSQWHPRCPLREQSVFTWTRGVVHVFQQEAATYLLSLGHMSTASPRPMLAGVTWSSEGNNEGSEGSSLLTRPLGRMLSWNVWTVSSDCKQEQRRGELVTSDPCWMQTFLLMETRTQEHNFFSGSNNTTTNNMGHLATSWSYR